MSTLTDTPVSRRGLLRSAGVAGIGLAGAYFGMSAFLNPKAAIASDGLTSSDQQIIAAAATAEALATTMYHELTLSPLFHVGLKGNDNDKAYLVAGCEHEFSHYNLLVSTGVPALTLQFYFPDGMFTDPSGYQSTINTLVTLEDAFVAAYLIGVRDFSTPALQVLAAQILGIECEHRVLARDIASDLGLTAVTGLSGVAEPVNGPMFAANNLAYERTFSNDFSTISDVVNALTPFVSKGAAGFSSHVYSFPAAGLPANIQPVTLANTSPS